MSKLLIVDDEPSICWGLRRLGEEMGHEVLTASSAEQALEMADDGTDAVVLDVRLPGMSGLEAINQLRRRVGQAPIIVITAYGDLDTAVEAVRQGAFEYLVKPFNLDQMQQVLERALAHEPSTQRDEPAPRQIGGLVGRSPAMQEVFKRIALVSASDACVLLQGESGVGKELAARAIHQYSRRSRGPLVAVNVAALNPTLTESELFGHVRGAFTGAEQTREGLISQANGGTLFLDEVAEIPLPTQVKLLRVLEHGEVTPVGGNRSVKTDFRVIAATHRNLLERVERGEFRHDLYFRLCAFQIDLPPLRQRGDDIEQLAEHFLGQLDWPPTKLTAAARAELKQRPWYGNVRELRNAIEHATIVARGARVGPEHLPPPAPPTLGSSETVDEQQQLAELLHRWASAQLAADQDAGNLLERLLALVEPPVLKRVLEAHRGQCAGAARTLGMHRTTLRKKLDQYGIEAE